MTVWFNTSNFPKTEVGSGKFRAPVQTLENLEMKKTLVAIAALAAATGAMAQSSVTLYGTLDAGFSGASYAKGNGDSVQRQGIAFGGNDTSRWGLTGKDDLGGGLSSEFKIESQIGTAGPRGGLGGTGISTNGGAAVKDYTMDAGITGGAAGAVNGTSSGFGTDSTVLGNRELWAALNNANSGTTLKVGYGVTAMRQLAVETDATGSNNYGNLIGHVVGGFRRSGIRVDQAVNSSLTASVEAFGGAQKSTNGTANGDTLVAKGYTANLQYKQGPVNAGVGYDSAANVNPAISGAAANGIVNTGNTFSAAANVAAANSITNTTLVAASYDLGAAKLFGQIWQQKYTDNTVTTGVGSGTWKGESVGVRVPVGKATYFGQYYSGKNQVLVSTTAGGENRKVTGPSAGVRYDLSKRTYTYFNAGFLKTDASANSAISGQAQDGIRFKQTSAGLVTYF
jgi:general bacterial porin, GBP family